MRMIILLLINKKIFFFNFKKFFIYFLIASLFIVICLYRYYSNQNLIRSCVTSTNEEMIAACTMTSRFNELPNYLDSVQTAYNFNYYHQNFQFKNQTYQKHFIKFYSDNFFDCKNLSGCNLKDEGKGYYVALNNCLLNGNCVENHNLNDCIESYDREITHTPDNFKYLIVATKEQACSNHIK